MADTAQCSIQVCKEVFLEIKTYWKQMVTGGITLLLLILGLWSWSFAAYRDAEKEQALRIAELESQMNEIAFIRSDATSILSNQKSIQSTLDNISRKLERIK